MGLEDAADLVGEPGGEVDDGHQDAVGDVGCR